MLRRFTEDRGATVKALLISLVAGFLLATSWIQSAASATYYVSSSGNDRNPGTSPERSWKTIDRVNSGKYGPGDSILFEGEKTFKGTLLFNAENSRGTPDKPITVSSYGEGRATIMSGKDSGLFATDVAAMNVTKLNFVGLEPGHLSHGLAFVNASKRTLSHIYIADVEISRYTNAIWIVATEPPSQYRHIKMERLAAHDNAMGPSFWGYEAASRANNSYGLTDIYIGHSRLYKNTGAGICCSYGAGLFLRNVQEVIIEHNVVYDNGGDNPSKQGEPNGPSGITLYDGRNVLIQHNEVYHQRYSPTTQTDNGGLDLWAINAVVQYNYIHDNEGWGFIHGSDPVGFGWRSGTVAIRYNIAKNNGRSLSRNKSHDYMGATVLMFGQVENFEIYNNTFYGEGSPSPSAKADAIQGMIYLVDVPGAGGPWSNIHVRNNVLIAKDDVTFIEVPRPDAGKDLRFENNAYVTNRETQPVKWGDKHYSTVGKWSNETGQEKIKGTPVSRVAALGALCAPGKDHRNAYQLKPASPLIDVGLDLRQNPFNHDVGKRDFYGNPVPHQKFDIGAHEYHPHQKCG